MCRRHLIRLLGNACNCKWRLNSCVFELCALRIQPEINFFSLNEKREWEREKKRDKTFDFRLLNCVYGMECVTTIETRAKHSCFQFKIQPNDDDILMRFSFVTFCPAYIHFSFDVTNLIEFILCDVARQRVAKSMDRDCKGRWVDG